MRNPTNLSLHLHVPLSLALGLASGCDKPAATADPSEAASGDAADGGDTTEAADPVAAQIEQGASLYGANCSGCHGDAGQGGGAPAVVGEGALSVMPPEGAKGRTGEFHTVTDVFDFVRAAMPPDDPTKLTDDEIWAILAFDLKANEVDAGGVLDAERAATLRLDE